MRRCICLVGVLFLSVSGWTPLRAQDFRSLSGLMYMRNVKNMRISSFDTTGGNTDCRKDIKPDETLTLCDIRGSGVIRHIWITISPPEEGLRRDLILRMYWDGQEHPSVLAPIGDFFGQGWGEYYNWSSAPLCAAPKEGRALVSYFPMPFRKSARITVQNDSGIKVRAFYYYVDYEETELADNVAYFHAWWNRQITEAPEIGESEWGSTKERLKNTDGKKNYVFVDAVGKGHFVGINYFVDSPTPVWYGEGDDMFFIDGEVRPRLHGTGTEDYFNTSWCPREPYATPYFGYARLNTGQTGWFGRTHVYRFHIQDPVHFGKSLLGTIEHGHANGLTLDLCTVAYWYQTLPHKAFPPIPPREKRRPMKKISVVDFLRWKNAWRKERENKPTLWGNEGR